jgi:hypothetical protein
MPADKNMGYVIMNKGWYENEIENHLMNFTRMNITEQEYLTQSKGEILATINSFKNILNQNHYRFLKEFKGCSVPQMMGLPKIHKNPPSSRPIVPCHTAPTKNISIFLDIMLRPVVDTMVPTHIKDSRQFIKLLANTPIHQGDSIGVYDVVALYTNIKRNKLIECVQWALRESKIYTASQRSCMITLTKLLLKFSSVKYKGAIYTQNEGIPMGTNVAPLLAIIYRGHYERFYLIPLLPPMSIFICYIDDYFYIVKNRDAFDFKTTAANAEYNMYVDGEVKTTGAIFLDVEIMVSTVNGVTTMDTKPFVKPQHAFQYIPRFSFHREAWQNAWIKAELIRFSSLSSNSSFFGERVRMFYEILRRRGHPHRTIMKSLATVEYHHYRNKVLRACPVMEPINLHDHTVFIKVPTDPLFRKEYWEFIFAPLRQEAAIMLVHTRRRNLRTCLKGVAPESLL